MPWDWVAIASLVFTAAGTIVALIALGRDRAKKSQLSVGDEAKALSVPADREQLPVPEVNDLVCPDCGFGNNRLSFTSSPLSTGQAPAVCRSCGAFITVGDYTVQVHGSDPKDVSTVSKDILSTLGRKGRGRQKRDS